MDLVRRSLLDSILSRMKHDRVVVLTGARQTGKTTLCEYQIPEETNLPYTYISFDDPDERLRFQKAAVSILESFDTSLVILDEVQKLPSFFEPLKLVVDRQQKQRGTGTHKNIFILTGSSQLLLMKNIRETLAGRVALSNLYPFSLREITVGNSTPLLNTIWNKQHLTDKDVKTFHSLSPEKVRSAIQIRNNHQSWGGYPPVWHKKEWVDKHNWLKDYRKTYLERDISDVGQVADIDTFAMTQKLLCARTANILSISEVARDVSLSVNTVKRYLNLLTMSFQSFLLPPYFKNIGKRFVKSPKIFFPDTGLNKAILGEMSISEGAKYESWVFSELIKWKQLEPVEPDLFFYKTGAGMEIDFLIAGKGRLVPVEAKSFERVTSADGRTLEAFLREYSKTSRIGIVVYPGKEMAEIRKNVWAVPDWYLFGGN